MPLHIARILLAALLPSYSLALTCSEVQDMYLSLSHIDGQGSGCCDADESTNLVLPTPLLKVGFLYGITGYLQGDQLEYKEAFDMAVHAFQAKYGDAVHVHTEAKDSSCGDGAITAASAQELAGMDIVVGPFCSGNTMAANAVLAPLGIPMISPSATNPSLSDDTAYPLFYRTCPPDSVQAAALADLLIKDGITTPCLVYAENSYGQGFGQFLTTILTEKGITSIAISQGAGVPSSEMAAQIATQVVNECDASVFLTYSSDVQGILTEIKNKDASFPMYGGDGMGGNNYATVHITFPSSPSSVPAPWENDNVGYKRETYDATIIALEAALLRHVLPWHSAIMAAGITFPLSGGDSFLPNGDAKGSGFEICEAGPSGTTCVAKWTAGIGIQ